MDSKIVHQFAGKLGLLGESNIIEKAKELLRLLEGKGTSLTQIGDYARCVICLDLATSLYGHEFDAQTALKLSGFKKPSYLNNRRIVEKLLELSKPTGVSEICVQLSLTEVQAPSKSILEQFISSSGLRNVDTTHPQYAAMAVYQMCKLRKIKIQKTKLISFSHLKASQWALLEKSWETWAKNNAEKLQAFQVGKKGDSHSIAGDLLDAATQNKENKTKISSITAAEQQQDTPAAEEYSDWRERVLQKAYEDLERLKAQAAAAGS